MRKVTALVSTVYFFLFFVVPAYAQLEDISISDIQPDGTGPKADTPVKTILTNAISIVYTVAALLVLAYLIWGAFKWITAGGNKESLKEARSMITNALIGLGLLSLSFLILRIVGMVLGIDVTTLVLPPLDKAIPGR